jgi:hypothetical protein
MRLVLAAVLLVALALPSGAQARYKNFSCVWRSGPEYLFTLHERNDEVWKSRSYLLEGFGTTCAYAKKWVARLAKEPYTGGKVPKPRTPALKHGPKGWRCQASFIFPSLKPKTAYHGVCQNNRDKRRVFSWESQSGDSEPVNPPPQPTPEPEPTPDLPPEQPTPAF